MNTPDIPDGKTLEDGITTPAAGISEITAGREFSCAASVADSVGGVMDGETARTFAQTIPESEERRSIPPNFVGFLEKQFVERHGVYPDNNPFVQYVRGLPILRAHPEIRIYITTAWDQKNAMVLPNGTIFLSDRLLKFFKYREELEFVLAHEIRHVESKHAERSMRGKELFERVGTLRFNEMEADLAVMIGGKNGTAINPHGGKVFMERFAAQDRHIDDIAHGDQLIRSLTMDHAIRLVDMDGLSEELTEIPAELKKSLKQKTDQWEVLKNANRESFEKAKRAASRIGPIGTIAHCDVLRKVGASRLGVPTHDQLSPDQREELTDIFAEKIRKAVAKQYPSASAAAQDLFVRFVISNQIYTGYKEVYLTSLPRLEPGMIGNPAVAPEFAQMLKNLPNPPDFLINNRFVWALLRDETQTAQEYDVFKQLWDGLKAASLMVSEDADFEGEEMMLAHLLVRTTLKTPADIDQCLHVLEQDRLQVDKDRLFVDICEHLHLPEQDRATLKEKAFFTDVKTEKLPDEFRHKQLIRKAQEVEDICVMKGFGPETRSRKLAKELIERVLDHIDLKSTKDFTDFLDAYAVFEHKLTGSTNIFGSRGNFPHLLGYSHEFCDQVARRIGGWTFTNEAAVHFMERLLSFFAATEWWFLMLFGQRRLSREELKRLSTNAEMDPHVAFLVWRQLKDITARAEAFDFLRFAYAEIFHHRPPEGSTVLEGQDSRNLPKCKASFSEIAAHIFGKYKFDVNDPEQVDELVTASCFIDDANLKLRLQKEAIKHRVRLDRDNEALYEFLFNDKRLADYAALEAREEYLDRHISTPEQLEKAKDGLTARIEGIDRKTLGSFALKTSLVNALLEDKLRLAKAMMETRENNGAFRTYIAEVLLAAHISEKAKGETYAAHIDKYFGRGEDTANIKGETPSVEKFEEILYQLDHESRYLICQQLLVGDGGVLLNKKSRKELLDWFFDNFITRPDNENEQQVHGFVKEAVQAVAEHADTATLYFFIMPLMVERILGKPERRKTWEAAMKDASTAITKRLKNEEDRYYVGEELLEAGSQILTLMTAAADDRSARHNDDEYGEQDEEQNKKVILRLNDLCGRYLTTVPETVQAISVIDFVKRLATQLGAPGVRFLQSLGIYVELAPELRTEFDDVYDNVKGQFKLSAWHTMQEEKRREPENYREVQALRQRAGGGSLVTAYESGFEGRKCVTKVRNPNVAYRVGQICDEMTKIFSASPRFKRALPIIANIKKWIETDVSFGDEVLSGQFFEHNNGFKPAGCEYEITVPRVLKRGKKYIHEEYVEGKNLTQWDELASERDMKQVVSCVVKNVLHQFAQGVVHADIHAGNIRVAPDKKIGLLDKEYLLVLDDKDKAFFGRIHGLMGDKPALAEAVAGYLCGFEENQHVNSNGLKQDMEAILAQNGRTDTGAFIGSLATAVWGREGIVPLKVMLLLKNVTALERMSRRAGFSNVIEALAA